MLLEYRVSVDKVDWKSVPFINYYIEKGFTKICNKARGNGNDYLGS